MWQSLLSGATGSLGLGGAGMGGAGIGEKQAAPSATAGDITSGDITPSVSGIYGGGFNVAPNINIAFPSAKVSSTNDINPALDAFTGSNLTMLGVGLGVVVLFFLIFRKG